MMTPEAKTTELFFPARPPPAQNTKKIRVDTERDHYMTGIEAKDYGLIDSVIASREEAPPSKESKTKKSDKN